MYLSASFFTRGPTSFGSFQHPVLSAIAARLLSWMWVVYGTQAISFAATWLGGLAQVGGGPYSPSCSVTPYLAKARSAQGPSVPLGQSQTRKLNRPRLRLVTWK